MNAAAELRAQVHALQKGNPDEARLAAERLVLLQRSAGAVPLCARLLHEAIHANDDAVAFIAAQTLAARARLASAEDAEAWPQLAPQLLGLLRSAGADGGIRVSVPVLRQLCVTLTRLMVVLVESWENSVEQLLTELRGLPEPAPMFEALQALAEEPFSRRLLIDGTRRSKFLMRLRAQIFAILLDIGRAASVRPGEAPVRCVAALLRAQPGFEDWLPMVSFAGSAHPALGALVPAMPVILRAASLELGFEAFEAAAELFEVAMQLSNDWTAPDTQLSIVTLLSNFVKTSTQLPVGSQAASTDSPVAVAEILANVVHAAFSSIAPLATPHVWESLLSMATRLLSLAALSRGLDADWDGSGLLGRSLDSWEVLAETYRDAHDAGKFSDTVPQMSMDTAFSKLLLVLPESLMLPRSLALFPEGLSSLRRRVPQVLVMWCDGNDERVTSLLTMLRSAAQKLPLPNGGTDVPIDSWIQLELVFFMAGSAAEVLASGGDASLQELPDIMGALCASLPRLPLAAAPQPWRSLTAAAAAEFIAALDPWITPARCPVTAASTSDLLRFLFGVIADQHAAAPAAEAIVVVVSNLAPQLASNAEVGRQVCDRLHHLCMGGSGLAPQVREKLVRSALGPVLSRLPVEQLDTVMEGMAAPLRAVASPSGGGASAADAAIASRLLFHLLAAPEVERPGTALAYLSAHWPWLESALSAGSSEPTVEAACHAVTKILAHARSDPAALQVLERFAPLLVTVAVLHNSVAALSALATLIRIFKGASASETLAERLAGLIVDGVRGILKGSPECVSQLPPDLLSALLEVLTIALGPRCVLLAPLLLKAPGVPLAEVLALVSPILPTCASPKCVCWALLLVERLPHWLQQTGPHVQSVAELTMAVLPHIAASSCQLLAASPLAADAEVSEALAKALLSLMRACPQAFASALGQAAESVGAVSDESSLLVQQVGDPLQTEEALAEALREAAQSWQAEHLRKALTPAAR